MSTQDVAVHALVTGRVQGVSYRWSTRAQAERLGLSGWVRNLPDGSVEAHVQGSAHAVGELATWMHEGPAEADVAQVEVAEADVDESLAGFEIR